MYKDENIPMDEASKERLSLYKKEQNKINYQKNNPYPLRLGELKDKMHSDASNNPELLGNTIHAVCINILKNHYEKKEIAMEIWLQKLIERMQINRHNIKNHIPLRKYGSRVKDHPTLF